MISQISPTELVAWREDASRQAPVIVDVREPAELEICQIEGSIPIPLGQIPARASELPPDADLVLVCHHGGRSQQAASWLERNGRANVHNLRGGVEAWALDVDPAMPRY